MYYAVAALQIRVVMHYGEYCLSPHTFGKNNKTTSQKEATEEETGLCPAQQEIVDELLSFYAIFIIKRKMNNTLCQDKNMQ
eukprot:15366571-Ditylum_brightwellii.AAC.1